jgi:hypothetical protein
MEMVLMIMLIICSECSWIGQKGSPNLSLRQVGLRIVLHGQIMVFLGVPITPRTSSLESNSKVQDLLIGKYGTQMAQKGLIPADYITDAMIGTMIDITHSWQEKYTADLTFNG